MALDSQNFSAEFLNGVGRTVGVNYVTDDAKAFMEQNPDWSNLQNKSIFIALRGLLFKYDKVGFPSSSDWLIMEQSDWLTAKTYLRKLTMY